MENDYLIQADLVHEFGVVRRINQLGSAILLAEHLEKARHQEGVVHTEMRLGLLDSYNAKRYAVRSFEIGIQHYRHKDKVAVAKPLERKALVVVPETDTGEDAAHKRHIWQDAYGVKEVFCSWIV